MKILQINATDNPIGGASRIAFDLYTGLKKDNVSSMIVGKKTQDDKSIQAISKTLAQKILAHLFANDLDFYETNFILDTKEFEESDIVNCHNLNGWYFNLTTLKKMSVQKPVVWTLHDMWAITAHCSHAYDGELKDGFYSCRSLKDYPSLLWNNEKYLTKKKRDIYTASNFTVVVPSKWLFEKVKKSVLGTKDIRLIYNGIDTSIFKKLNRNEARAKLNLSADKKVVLFVANNGLENAFKGGDHVKSLIEQNKNDSSKVFVCLGGEEDVVKENVIFRKKVSNKNTMAEYLNACDVLIFPSLAENFPLIILEAMACGTPIVSFDVGGVTEALQHLRNGYITKDINEGLKYIDSLSPSESDQMAQNSISDVQEKFSLEKMVKDYTLLYNELINKK